MRVDVRLVRKQLGRALSIPNAFAVEPDRLLRWVPRLSKVARRSRDAASDLFGTEDGASLAGISTMSWPPVRRKNTRSL